MTLEVSELKGRAHQYIFKFLFNFVRQTGDEILFITLNKGLNQCFERTLNVYIPDPSKWNC